MICAALALLVAGNALYGYFAHGLVYLPDFDLYTQGGVGLYPSLPGRLLGGLGPDVFALLSSLSAGGIVYLVGRRFGSWSALGLVLGPFTLVVGYAGIDSIALFMLTVALVGIRPLVFAPLAALTHWMLFPFTVLELYRRRPNLWVLVVSAWCVGVPLFLALSLTPYRGVLTVWADPRTLAYFVVGTVLAVVFAGPLWLVVPYSWANLIPFLMSGALMGVQQHIQARYMLPAVLLLSLQARRPSFLPRGAPALSAEAARP